MKKFYSYEEFEKDIELLSNKIKKYNPDSLLAIARGGLTIGHFLSEKLNIREIYTINAISYENNKKIGDIKLFNIPDLSKHKKIVLIDDISDTGETLYRIKEEIKNLYPQLEIKTATLFYKKTSKVIPNFFIKETNEWIIFFWNK